MNKEIGFKDLSLGLKVLVVLAAIGISWNLLVILAGMVFYFFG